MNRAWKMLLGRRAVFNLQDGSAVDGVLWDSNKDFVVIKDAILHEKDIDPIPMDGEIVIERTKVMFYQFVGGG